MWSEATMVMQLSSERVVTAPPEQSEQFQQRIKELFRRRLVSEFMRSRNTTEPGKKTLSSAPGLGAKDREGIRYMLTQSDRLSQALLSNDFNVPEEVAVVSADISKQVQEILEDESSAVVIVGSQAHGGGLVRRVFHTESLGDYDWGIVSDEAAEPDNPEFVSRLKHCISVANQVLMENSAYLGGRLRTCPAINPLLIYRPNLMSSQQVANFISSLQTWQIIEPDWVDKLSIYLYPSFPAKVNQKNEQLLLDGFKLLHRQSPELWETATEFFLLNWGELHRMKEKYFDATPDYKPIHRRKMEEVVDLSKTVMSRPLHEKLQATAQE